MTDQKSNAANNLNNRTNQKESSTKQPSLQGSASSDDINPPKTNTNYRHNNKHWLDYAVAIFALIAAIGGGFAAYFTGRQAWIAKDTEIVNNEAILVANSVSLVTYSDTSEKPRRWLLAPVIENVGNTPTKNLRYISYLSLCENRPTREGLDAQFSWRTIPASSFVRNDIGPKSSINGINLEMAGVSIDCQWTARAAGLLKFQDVFGYPHLFEFCTLVQLPHIDFQNYPIGQPIHIQGIGCGYHNCTDSECGFDWKQRAIE